MKDLKRLWLALVAVGHLALSVALAVERFMRFDAAVTSLYFVGFATVVVVLSFYHWFDLPFEGMIEIRRVKWSAITFVTLCGCLVLLTLVSISPVGISLQPKWEDALPRLLISLILAWLGFMFLFGPTFLGKKFSPFFLNPIAWMFRIVRSRLVSRGRP
jgi:hypothetical protein